MERLELYPFRLRGVKKAKNKRSYRAKNPNAYIICLYGFTTKNTTISNGIEAAVQEMKDSKIRYLSEGFSGDGSGVVGHPPVGAQRRWGDTLATYIQKLMYLEN